ncbi:unnamed protein product [Bemisia tabaci]|uniref:Tesmin/TSO1-like CXC domain-containing protein n=1 Tax=Bemisia tabaci TaxID=7038 RepID=A0A9P0AHM4_BEMTA|nr:unnamed protein product [Bemisia tabaci]
MNAASDANSKRVREEEEEERDKVIQLTLRRKSILSASTSGWGGGGGASKRPTSHTLFFLAWQCCCHRLSSIRSTHGDNSSLSCATPRLGPDPNPPRPMSELDPESWRAYSRGSTTQKLAVSHGPETDSSESAILIPHRDLDRSHCVLVSRYFRRSKSSLVQEWQGEKNDPCNWDWKATKNGLTPITTLDSPAPENILKLIACKCKKGCRKTCGCRKNGLRCTILCQMCNQSSDNFQMEHTLQGEEEEGYVDEPEIMTF